MAAVSRSPSAWRGTRTRKPPTCMIGARMISAWANWGGSGFESASRWGLPLEHTALARRRRSKMLAAFASRSSGFPSSVLPARQPVRSTAVRIYRIPLFFQDCRTMGMQRSAQYESLISVFNQLRRHPVLV